jgi:hypothetical protein
MIEIVREPSGPVTIRITDESIDDVKEILSSLFRENSFVQGRIQALSSRFEGLESSIGQLMGVNQELAEVLVQRKEERRTHLPARGTKYFQILWDLCSAHLDGKFTSDDVSQREKHILSILKNEYDVLEVAEKKGRRNYYRIKTEIAKEILKDKGHWFSIMIDSSIQPQADALIADERESNPFLVDVREAESGLIHEFFFAEPEIGEAFEQKILSVPKE